MTPTFYVIYGIILTLLAAGLMYFGAMSYYLAVAVKEFNNSLSDLAVALHGLPQNLYGISPAMAKLADGVTLHEAQMAGLVNVIAEANKGLPADRPEKFDENGKDTNWQASIPPSPFEEEDRG